MSETELLIGAGSRSDGCGTPTRGTAILVTVQVAATKIFLGGFGWQAAAILSRQPSSSFGYSAAAGFGDALGVFVGNLLVICSLFYWQGWPGCAHVVESGLIVSTGSFLSGAIWQQLVNRLHDGGLSFTAGMTLTGLGCGACFYIGITMVALLATRGRRSPLDFAKDLTLSVAISGATAAFVGTDMAWHGNWLQVLVGERRGTSPLSDCLRAGSSEVIGFCAIQLILIAFVPSHLLWTTPNAEVNQREPNMRYE